MEAFDSIDAVESLWSNKSFTVSVIILGIFNVLSITANILLISLL